MTSWATVTCVAATAIWVALWGGSSHAGEVPEREPLLSLESQALGDDALDAETARGVADTDAGLQGQTQDIGVILWDELKPSRPNGPQPVPTDQGTSRIQATSN